MAECSVPVVVTLSSDGAYRVFTRSASRQPVFTSEKRPLSASEPFDFVEFTPALVSRAGSDPLTPGRAGELLVSLGLKRIRKSDDRWWSLVDGSGEVKILAGFLPDKVSFDVLFFPADGTPVPDPLLSTLLARAAATTLKGGSMEIAVPTAALTANDVNSSCRRHNSMTILLSGSVLIRQREHIECDAK